MVEALGQLNEALRTHFSELGDDVARIKVHEVIATLDSHKSTRTRSTWIFRNSQGTVVATVTKKDSTYTVNLRNIGV